MLLLEIVGSGAFAVISIVCLYLHFKRRLSRPLTLRHRLLASGSVNRA